MKPTSFKDWCGGIFNESWFVYFGLVIAKIQWQEFKRIRKLVSKEEAKLYGLAFTIAELAVELERGNPNEASALVLCHVSKEDCSDCLIGLQGSFYADGKALDKALKKYSDLYWTNYARKNGRVIKSEVGEILVFSPTKKRRRSKRFKFKWECSGIRSDDNVAAGK